MGTSNVLPEEDHEFLIARGLTYELLESGGWINLIVKSYQLPAAYVPQFRSHAIYFSGFLRVIPMPIPTCFGRRPVCACGMAEYRWRHKSWRLMTGGIGNDGPVIIRRGERE